MKRSGSSVSRSMVWALWMMVGLLPGWVPAVWAQTAPATATATAGADDEQGNGEGSAEVEVDLSALLKASTLLPATVEDAIWQITPSMGRQLVQIPLTIRASQGATELQGGAIKVRGGRFLAFRLPDAAEQAQESGQVGGNQPGPGAGGQPAIPRFARSIQVEPGGKVRWKMERMIPNGSVRESEELYALKIRSDLLERLSPDAGTAGQARTPVAREAREPGGERTPMTAAQRQEAQAARARALQERQAAQAERQAKMQQFQETRRKVMALPTEFEERIPVRVWAIYELRAGADELALGGKAPLPWSMSLADLEAVRSLASKAAAAPQGGAGEAGSAALPAEVAAAVGQVSRLASSGHPYSHRLAAQAIASAHVAGLAQPGDALHRLMQTLVQSQDALARRTMIKELATTIPPTASTATLIKLASQNMDPSLQLMALASALRGDAGNAAHVQEMVSQAQRLLGDPKGPPAGEVLDSLLMAVSGGPGQPGGQPQQGTAALLGPLSTGLRFDGLPDQRRDQAIAHVIEKAATQPLAAAWLDGQLLKSADMKLVTRTLEILSQSRPAGAGLGPVIDRALDLVFGAATKKPAAAAAALPAARLTQPIPVSSPWHGLFLTLRSGNPQVRALAWDSLGAFELVAPGSSDPNQKVKDPLQELVEIALEQSPTPSQAVLMLSRQKDAGRGAWALFRIVMYGSGEAVGRAARVLLGGGYSVDSYVMALSFEDREKFAARMYESASGRVPLVAGLLREKMESNPLPGWFARQIAGGHLPDPSEWAGAVGVESRLVELVLSTDQQLGLAASAALAASAGGGEETAREVYQLIKQGEQTPAAAQANWAKARQQIHSKRLQQANGTYRLVLRIKEGSVAGGGGMPGMPPEMGPGMPPEMPPGGPEGMPPGGPPMGGPPAQTAKVEAPKSAELTLGLVQLQADAQGVRLVNQTLAMSLPEGHLAIRIANPTELKNFRHEELAQMPLENASGPLDLLPQQDGSWRGAVNLPDNRMLEVVLQPAKE